jgi:hypothetical protein
MASIRAKVKDRTRRSRASWDLDAVIEDLNPVLRGWGAYFRFGNSTRKFHTLDSYVHFRLARLASAKIGKSGRSWTRRFDYGWFTTLGVHRLTGTVRYWTAHA